MLDPGIAVNSDTLAPLVNHELTPGLDGALSIENAVDHHALSVMASQIAHINKTLGKRLRTALGDTMLDQFGDHIRLNPAIQFKLTIAREQRPEIIKQGIVAALIGGFLAKAAGYSRQQIETVMTAGMLRDIGMLHIDPHIFRAGNPEQIRRMLDDHPSISHTILNAYPEYRDEIARAVLQHHERLDGSGYPRHVSEGQLNETGQLIAIAELVSSGFNSRGHCIDCARTSFILQVNSYRLNSDMVKPVLELLRGCSDERPKPISAVILKEEVTHIASILTDWEIIERFEKLHPHNADETEMLNFINQRLQAMRLNLAYAGFYPSNVSLVISTIDEDPIGRRDLSHLVAEIRWQLKEILHESIRHWPKTVSLLLEDECPLGDWLRHLEDVAWGPDSRAV